MQNGSLIEGSQIPASGVYLGSDPYGDNNVLQIQLPALSPSYTFGFYTLTGFGSNSGIQVWHNAAETEAVVPGETVFDACKNTTLYVENVGNLDSGQITLQLNWTPNALPGFQSDVLSTLHVDLMGNLGAESDNYVGYLTRVSNVGQDSLASQPAVAFVPVYQQGQNGLIPLMIETGSQTGGNYQLNFTGSNITIWANSNETDQITSGQSLNGLTTLYVAGVTASAANSPTAVALQWLPDPSEGNEEPTPITVDTIDVTVVRAVHDHPARPRWKCRNTDPRKRSSRPRRSCPANSNLRIAAQSDRRSFGRLL